MATTATLVYADSNKLRYLIDYSGAGGTSVTITSTGAATPDLLTDTIAGPLKALAKAFTDGFAAFAAGALTQAQARALWLSDWAGADPAPGDPAGVPSRITTAMAQLTMISDAVDGTQVMTVDANVDGPGHPTIVVTAAGIGGNACAGYLDIMVPQAIG